MCYTSSIFPRELKSGSNEHEATIDSTAEELQVCSKMSAVSSDVCVVGEYSSMVILVEPLHSEDERITVFRNVGNYSPVDTAKRPSRSKSS
jgi:hypothetical protein